MIVSPIEWATRRALNDRRIFWMPQELIDRSNWAQFRKALQLNDKSTINSLLDSTEKLLATKINNERDGSKKRHLEDARELLTGLRTCVNENSVSVLTLTEQLDTFGPLRSNLPNMEDFGKVIENYGRATAEQFFLYKIQKEKERRRREGLIALWEVAKELYEKRIDPLEIAFFVRKIESLPQIVEVLKCRPSKI
ncbi:MAG TPA: hypothetical protein VGL91_04605 [Acidobacteriota bacterium]|jgi:hypothetical protein